MVIPGAASLRLVLPCSQVVCPRSGVQLGGACIEREVIENHHGPYPLTEILAHQTECFCALPAKTFSIALSGPLLARKMLSSLLLR